jgi:GntR family transcriptional regulator, carbon starvation induced regulator
MRGHGLDLLARDVFVGKAVMQLRGLVELRERCALCRNAEPVETDCADDRRRGKGEHCESAADAMPKRDHCPRAASTAEPTRGIFDVRDDGIEVEGLKTFPGELPVVSLIVQRPRMSCAPKQVRHSRRIALMCEQIRGITHRRAETEHFREEKESERAFGRAVRDEGVEGADSVRGVYVMPAGHAIADRNKLRTRSAGFTNMSNKFGFWGGLRMVEFAWGPKVRWGLEAPSKTLAEEALRRLRRDIISGRLTAGQRIKADELKGLYGVGVSPLREALFQLVSDGLVRADGQRGFSVAALDRDELRDITDWRARLESEALRRSIVCGDVAWEARLVSTFHSLKRIEQQDDLEADEAADRWEDAHRSFHFALYSACGSPWLLRFCELLIEHGERYRRAYIAYPRVAPSITAEHQDILDKALARDEDGAAAALRDHIAHAAQLSEMNAPLSDPGAAKQVSSLRRASRRPR